MPSGLPRPVHASQPGAAANELKAVVIGPDCCGSAAVEHAVELAHIGQRSGAPVLDLEHINLVGQGQRGHAAFTQMVTQSTEEAGAPGAPPEELDGLHRDDT